MEVQSLIVLFFSLIVLRCEAGESIFSRVTGLVKTRYFRVVAGCLTISFSKLVYIHNLILLNRVVCRALSHTTVVETS